MTRIVALTAALVSLMRAFDAQAQDGLRSASLPERPVATTPPPACDLSRVRVIPPR